MESPIVVVRAGPLVIDTFDGTPVGSAPATVAEDIVVNVTFCAIEEVKHILRTGETCMSMILRV